MEFLTWCLNNAMFIATHSIRDGARHATNRMMNVQHSISSCIYVYSPPKLFKWGSFQNQIPASLIDLLIYSVKYTTSTCAIDFSIPTQYDLKWIMKPQKLPPRKMDKWKSIEPTKQCVNQYQIITYFLQHFKRSVKLKKITEKTLEPASYPQCRRLMRGHQFQRLRFKMLSQ